MSHDAATRRGFLRTAGVAVAGLSGASKVGARLTETGAPGQPQLVFDVREYGAKGDGTSVDSPAINHAIEAAAKAGAGRLFSRPELICATPFD